MGLVLGPRTSKPPPGSRVDWSNPINRGLAGWWLFNEGSGESMFDLVQGAALTRTLPSSVWVGSPRGGAFYVDGTGELSCVDGISNLDGTGITVSFYMRKTVNQAAFFGGLSTDSSFTNRRMRFRDVNFSGAFRPQFYRSFSGGEVSWRCENASQFPALGQWARITFSQHGTDQAFILIDDVNATLTAPSPSGTPLTGVDSLDLNGRIDALNLGDFEYEDVRLWNRALSLEEARSIVSDPYGGILPHRVYFPSTAPAAEDGSMHVIWPKTNKPPPGWRPDLMAPINRDLWAWWLFNEGGGNVAHDIVGGLDGTLTNKSPATDWVGSPHGGALKFNRGSDERVLCGVIPMSLLPELTFSVAFTYNGGGSPEHYLMSNLEGTFNTGSFYASIEPATDTLECGVRVNDQIWVTCNATDLVMTPGDGALHRVTCTWKRGTFRLWLDGVESANSGATGGNFLDAGTSEEVHIGAAPFNTTDCLDGTIDDARIWFRELGPEEIAHLHANPYG